MVFRTLRTEFGGFMVHGAIGDVLDKEILKDLSPLLRVEKTSGHVYVSARPNKGDSNEEEALWEMEKLEIELASTGIIYKPMFRNHPGRDRLDAVAIPL